MGQYETSDLALAAFLTLRGLKLVSAERLESGRFQFILDDSDKKADTMAIDFFSSEFCEYDNKIRSLKKILYSK
tara:strand:- start:115 stop:336 length:222 start_codon:yes stop_codon:yes gene_type:complete